MQAAGFGLLALRATDASANEFLIAPHSGSIVAISG
jgi:hypothetical protein